MIPLLSLNICHIIICYFYFIFYIHCIIYKNPTHILMRHGNVYRQAIHKTTQYLQGFLGKQKIVYFLLKSNTIIHNKTDKVSFDTIFNIYMFKFICTYYEVCRLSRDVTLFLELAQLLYQSLRGHMLIMVGHSRLQHFELCMGRERTLNNSRRLSYPLTFIERIFTS